MKASTAFFAGLIASTGSTYAFVWGAGLLVVVIAARAVVNGWAGDHPG